MDFTNHHDLLIYLVNISDDADRNWRLQTGQQLVDLMKAEKRFDCENMNGEAARLGQLLWTLSDDNSIQFRSSTPRPYFLTGTTYDELTKFEDIVVTSNGRTAVSAWKIATFDLTTLFDRWDRAIETEPADVEAKAEAHSRVRAAGELVIGVGKTTTTELISTALRRALGLP